MIARTRRLHGRLLDSPVLLLTLAALFWAGNTLAAKLAVGHIAPMTLTCLRWMVVCLVLGLFARQEIARAAPLLRRHWALTLAMGALGYTAFNALFYLAGHRTTAVNLSILQGAIPVLVILGALLFFGTRATAMQIAGLALGLIGVVLVASNGDLAVLTALTFNAGDLWMLIACALYSGYTLALRWRPALPDVAFFAGMAGAAGLTSLPLLAVEIAQGDAFWPTPQGWAVLVYVALFPSLLSQLFFMRGVELIGPGRAGLFSNLTPVFGALLAVVALGEPFGLHSALALALVLGGILIAERFGRPRRAETGTAKAAPLA